MKPTPRKPRWLLLRLLLLIPWAGVLALKMIPALEQYSYAQTFAIIGAIVVSVMLIALWLLVFSGLAWSTRFKGLLGLIVVLGATLGMVRKDGHMGDFLPQISFRWVKKPGDQLAPLTPVADNGSHRFSTDQPGDFPRFLGLDGRNDQKATLLAENWYQQNPKELWRSEVGLGWGGFIVAGDYAITLEQRGENEAVVARDVRTGAALWVHEDKARFEEDMGGTGPRTTPLAADDKVWTLGATGILNCLDGKTGRLLWKRDTLKEAGHENLGWAKSSSPILVDDMIIVTLGKGEKSLAAYRAATGEPVWRSGAKEAGYATPVLAEIAGVRQILAVFAKSAGGYDPATGAAIWEWTENFKSAPANVANPMPYGSDGVLISIGYGIGSSMIKFDPTARTPTSWPHQIEWQTMKMKPKFTNLVLRGDHAWGLDEGRLSCLDLKTGQQLWRGASYGHGQIMGAGDTLIIQSEKGEVVIARASTTAEEILARIPALTSKTWNTACLAGNLLLVRNDREAICLELPRRAAAVP